MPLVVLLMAAGCCAWYRNTMIPKHSELSRFALEAHQLAKSKGWYDTPREWSDLVMLCQGELHEANEFLRKGHPPAYAWTDGNIPDGEIVVGNDGDLLVRVDTEPVEVLESYDPASHGKPDGFIVELADCVIRCLDAITYRGGRPIIAQPPGEVHIGALRRCSAREFLRHAALNRFSSDMSVRDLADVVTDCLEWADAHSLPLWEAMALKHRYDATRGVRHGKVF